MSKTNESTDETAQGMGMTFVLFGCLPQHETCSFALGDGNSFRALNGIGTHGRANCVIRKYNCVIFKNYYYGYQIKDELSGIQGRRGEIRNACRIFVGNFNGRYHLRKM
jgi:hypothetical protein